MGRGGTSEQRAAGVPAVLRGGKESMGRSRTSQHRISGFAEGSRERKRQVIESLQGSLFYLMNSFLQIFSYAGGCDTISLKCSSELSMQNHFILLISCFILFCFHLSVTFFFLKQSFPQKNVFLSGQHINTVKLSEIQTHNILRKKDRLQYNGLNRSTSSTLSPVYFKHLFKHSQSFHSDTFWLEEGILKWEFQAQPNSLQNVPSEAHKDQVCFSLLSVSSFLKITYQAFGGTQAGSLLALMVTDVNDCPSVAIKKISPDQALPVFNASFH